MKIGNPPEPLFTSETEVYVILQLGNESCINTSDCPGSHRNWVVNVIPLSAPPGEDEQAVISGPTNPVPASFSSIPGPDADLDVSTGHITSTASLTGSAPGSRSGSSTTIGVRIPVVAGESAATARGVLQSLGFVVTLQYSASTVVPQGDVIALTPPSGTTTIPGAAVTLLVSSGPPASGTPAKG
ncbi:MAG TPA: PASTA domain-containing protein [Acidimicrobiales bacterium]